MVSTKIEIQIQLSDINKARKIIHLIRELDAEVAEKPDTMPEPQQPQPEQPRKPRYSKPRKIKGKTAKRKESNIKLNRACARWTPDEDNLLIKWYKYRKIGQLRKSFSRSEASIRTRLWVTHGINPKDIGSEYSVKDDVK